MKFRNTLILIAIAVALGAFVFLVERKSTPPDAAQTTPIATPLALALSFDASDARGVIVTQTDNAQRTELVYQADGLWHLVAPVQDEADQEQVIRFVESLAQLRPSRTLTETVGQPSDYDLDPPAITIAVAMQDGSTHVLGLGAMNPARSSYYGQVAGDATIYLMPFAVGADAERMLNSPPVKPTPTPEMQATLPPLIPPPPTTQP